MPYLKIQSSIKNPDNQAVKALLTILSAKLAKHLGKPESYIMTAFEADVSMTFAGTFDPVCYLEIKSVGAMKPEQTIAMSQDFCQVIAEQLGIPSNRTYIEFTDAKGYLWGWNEKTFA